MKLDLCNIFNVKENQHFWIKYKNTEKSEECYIKDNKLFSIGGDLTGVVQSLDIFSIDKICYEKPILLDENTIKFLKLIECDFNIICKVNEYEYMIKDDFNNKHNFKINSLYFKINLSELEVGKDYNIRYLVGDD